LRQARPSQGYPLTVLVETGLISREGRDTFCRRVIFPCREQGHSLNLYGRSIGTAPAHRFLPRPKGGLFAWENVRGFARVILVEGLFQIQYSTLTRLLRQLGLRRSREPRCQRVPDSPGAEMQHDTTRYSILLGGARSMLVASLLYLRYSKRRYLRFYRMFNRFRMKCFLHEALMFWEHAAPVCIIDNTNLARLRGTGRDAVIVPEMEAFAKQYGFRFVCQEKGHANRKAGEERSFWTVETNFLPGRRFQSLEDLNQQAFQWATVRMEHRPVAKSRLIPAQAFDHERHSLVKLPTHLPAPYLVHERDTDQYGYAAFDGNYYWVPGTSREEVNVFEYADRVKTQASFPR
jgi:hypothetical protein